MLLVLCIASAAPDPGSGVPDPGSGVWAQTPKMGVPKGLSNISEFKPDNVISGLGTLGFGAQNRGPRPRIQGPNG